MSKGPVPPATPPPAAPAAKAKAKAQPTPAPTTSGGGGSGGLSFALALSNLDEAEDLAYGTAFAGFGMGAENGSVPLECQPMREFIAANSSCPYDQVDIELLRAAQATDEMRVSKLDFMLILRQHATSDMAILEKFEGVANGGEAITSEECRTALMLFKDDMGAPAGCMDEAHWNQVYDVVMSNAEANVSREAFRDYCFKEARIANLVHFAKLK